MRTIDEFLLARIAEEEQQARDDGADAMSGARWKHCPDDAYYELQSLTLARSRRMLAECEAKRRIVGLHTYEWMGNDDAAEKGCEHDYEPWPCPTLRILAAVYADHPDFDERWRP